uniref:Uncharacterized protein n=1 Tax=Arundo donax TaxID=35708 RepID=A0A0A9F2E7_ARUDO
MYKIEERYHPFSNTILTKLFQCQSCHAHRFAISHNFFASRRLYNSF